MKRLQVQVRDNGETENDSHRADDGPDGIVGEHREKERQGSHQGHPQESESKCSEELWQHFLLRKNVERFAENDQVAGTKNE